MPAVLAGAILLANRYGRSGPVRADSAGRGASAATRPADTRPGTGTIPPGYGLLVGAIGPRLPGQGALPDLTLQFTNGTLKQQTEARGGRYEIVLPAGTWSVREASGRVCARGISLLAGRVTNDDLVYGIAGCQSFGG